MGSQVLRDYVNRHLDSTSFVAATFATPWWMVQSTRKLQKVERKLRLLHRALSDTGKIGVAKVAISSRISCGGQTGRAVSDPGADALRA